MVPRVHSRSEHPEGRELARRLGRLGRKFLLDLGLPDAELSIVLTTDVRIRDLNRAWRRRDEATDVLSFPGGEGPRPDGERVLIGDVVISLDTARARVQRARRPLEEELARYLAHGLLHLIGHDHRNRKEAALMAAEEGRLLGKRGMVFEARGRGHAVRRR
jgi:probable rRNA maturation factor